MFEPRKAIFGLACLCGVIAFALLPSGCDLLSDGGGGTGTLQMLITDAPFPFSLVTEANVTITRIEVRQDSSADGGTADAEDVSDDDEDENENSEDDDDGDDDNSDDDGSDEGEIEIDNEDEDENDNGKATAAQTMDDDDNDSENENEDENADDDGEDDEDGTDDAEDDDDDDETAEAGDGDSDGGGSAFVTILDEAVSFNLLDLQNGVTASLASASLAAGSYSQIRFIVSSGHVVLADGREFELTVPSGEQTGIKLRFDFTITGDETTILLLDMDVSKAFVPIPGGDVNDASQIRRFLFKPSLALSITELE